MSFSSWPTTPGTATFAALLGCELPAHAGEDSFNALPVILGTGPAEPRPCLIADTGWFACERGDFAMRCGRWKIIEKNHDGKADPTFELYDIEDDPGEQRNLAQSETSWVLSLRNLLDGARAAKGLRSFEAGEPVA